MNLKLQTCRKLLESLACVFSKSYCRVNIAVGCLAHKLNVL